MSDGFRPVAPLWGATIFNINVGSADIAAFLQFQTVSDLFLSRDNCFPAVSDGYRPVPDLFGMSNNFHINVRSGDIAAFLQFQPVSDLCQIFGAPTSFHINEGSGDIVVFLLFQTSLRRPIISI